MGGVEKVAIDAGASLLNQGAIGLLALFGWMAVVVMGTAIIVMWKALRASESDKVKILTDAAEAAEKERAEQDRKMDRLQAVLEAKVRR